MSKHSEKDFIIPAIRVIYKHGGICTTNTIKDEANLYMTLSPEDLELNPSRNNEPKYKQIIGNLISHKKQDFYKYIEAEIVDDEKNKKSPKYLLKLNEKGAKLAESYETKSFSTIIGEQRLDCLLENIEENNEIDDLDKRVLKALEKDNLQKRIPTNSTLSQTVNRLNKHVCQYARILGENHCTYINENGVPLVIGHHLIPIKASRDFFPRNLDRASNIVTLCPNCHEAIHHGSSEVKKKMLKALYDKHIRGLNKEEIYISLEDLFNKYYK